jgi:hypothetical protein
MYNRPNMWPQYWDLGEPRGLEQRDLRNLNLGDLKKGPNGGISPTPQKITTTTTTTTTIITAAAAAAAAAATTTTTTLTD